MPSSRHHNEWLSLIEVSGPFLSVPVLERVLPQGLDAHDPDHTRLLKLAFEEWEDNQQGERPNPAIHREWVNFVLKQTLGLPDEVIAEGQNTPQTLNAKIAEHGETLRPDLVVRNPEGSPSAGKPRLLIQLYHPSQDLEKPLHGRHWKASPATRMMELLHATDVRLGLITNGSSWMLVDAPKGETTGFITWDATYWAEEPLTLRAFRTLLGVHRFFSVADDETLEAMLQESASNQQEVTDRLGYQVREAVEEIIRSLDTIDQDHGGELLAGIAEAELYEAALTVMMRLVFLFSAEERGLLLLGDPLFDDHRPSAIAGSVTDSDAALSRPHGPPTPNKGCICCTYCGSCRRRLRRSKPPPDSWSSTPEGGTMAGLKQSVRPDLRPPTEAESRMARESSRRLGPMVADLVLKEGDPSSSAAEVVVQVKGRPAAETLEIPLAALKLLGIILSEMARGNAVTLTPVHAELTTHQAAAFLNVSRPYLIKQLESGMLPFRKVGTHRRIALRDLLEYKEQSDRERDQALEELARLTQELGEDD